MAARSRGINLIMKWKMVDFVISCLLALALIASSAPWVPAIAAPNTDGRDKIDQALLTKVLANPDQSFPIIVSMEPSRENEAHGELAKQGGKIGRELSIIKSSSTTVSGRTILGLARAHSISQITEDAPVKIMGTSVSTTSTVAVGAPGAWDLGYTGKGVGVAVLDSGVAPHPDLTQPTNRIVASVDLISGTTGTVKDLGGHGTHVAGIIAGNGYSSNGERKGIAPDANIVSVKVTDDSGYASYSSVIAGVQWVIKNKRDYNIRVMNLSLGTTIVNSYHDDPLIAALEVAWFSGIVVVAAAGNSGPDYGTISTPGNDPYAITVGALDDMGTANRSDDTIASFSSRGPTAIDRLSKPDLVAPGRRVISLRATGSYLDSTLPDRLVDDAYFRLSGTSMAAPVVAGIVALILQKNPSLQPNQVKYILTHTTTPMSYDRYTAGAGSVNALAAITYAGQGISNRMLEPNAIFATTIYSLAKGAPLVWRDPTYKGRNWASYTWETLPWDSYTWENFSWESIDWTAAGWSSYTWEDFTWKSFTWENFTWDSATTASGGFID